MEFRSLVLREFKVRQTKNPNFSLRAFARFLDVSPSHLSLFLSGRRNLSFAQQSNFVRRLALSRREAKLVEHREMDRVEDAKTKQLTEDEMEAISSWEYFAVLGLAQLDVNRSDMGWVARNLGVGKARAAEVFRRLERLGMIRCHNGGFVQATPPLRTSRDVPSSALRSFHRSVNRLAADKLESVPVEQRSFSSIFLTMDSKELDLAKSLIRRFRRKMERTLEQGKKNSVFSLSIQMFPVSQVEEE